MNTNYLVGPTTAVLLMLLFCVAFPAGAGAQLLPACDSGVVCQNGTICAKNKCWKPRALFAARYIFFGQRATIAALPIRPLDHSPDTEAAARWLNAIFKQNFGGSPHFKLLPEYRFPLDWRTEVIHPTTAPRHHWRAVRADGLVAGWVRQISPGRLEIFLFLLPFVPRTAWAPPVIKVFVSADRGNVRSLGHLFSNQVARSFIGRTASFGSRIAYSKQIRMGVKEIYYIEYLSRKEVQVTKDGSLAILPSWTRDGRLAYTSYRRGNPDLYIGKRVFSARRKLNIGAAFAPDGRKVAISLSKDGNTELYLLDARSGAIIKRLTRRRSAEISPSWSADGTRLAFVSDRSGTPQVYMMGLNDLKPTRVSKFGGYNTSPNWSPDGTMIAYCGQTGASSRFDIFVYDVATGKVRRITQSGKNERPAFSPDSRWLVFSRRLKKSQNLYVIRADGTGLKKLELGPGKFFAPAWSL